MQETHEMWIWSLGQDNSLEKEMATHLSILAWKSRGQRSLVGYSPCGCKELDVTEWVCCVFIDCFIKCFLFNSSVSLSFLKVHIIVFFIILIISNFKKIELIMILILLSLYWVCHNIASVLCFRFWPWGTWDLEPAPPALEARSLSPWTAREVPTDVCFFLIHQFLQRYGSIVEMYLKHREIHPF